MWRLEIPNPFDNVIVDTASYAYRDLLSLDRWESFVPTASLTAVGTPAYLGLYRVVGAQCFWQVKITPATSIATTAGTSYLNLPRAASGYGGMVSMVDLTALTSVGTGVIDTSTGRAYLPTQSASAHVFVVSGWQQI